MAINTQMSGKEIDRVLKAINDAEDVNNNNKVIYIRRGELAFEDGQTLFSVTELV